MLPTAFTFCVFLVSGGFFFTVFQSNVLVHPCCHGDLPNSDEIVGVASEEGLAVGRPRQADTLGWLGLGAGTDDLLSQLINHNLTFEVLKHKQRRLYFSSTLKSKYLGPGQGFNAQFK